MIGNTPSTLHILTSLSSKNEPQELVTAVILLSSGETELGNSKAEELKGPLICFS